MKPARRRRRPSGRWRPPCAASPNRPASRRRCAKRQAIAAHELPALRDSEAAAAAALVRLKRGLDELEAENRRARQRAEELGRRLAELQTDLARQDSVARDATESLARLTEEDRGLAREGEGAAEGAPAAAAALSEAEAALAAAEADHAAAQAALSELGARRGALERALRETRERETKAVSERERLLRDQAALDASSAATPLEGLRSAVAVAELAMGEADAGTGAARAGLAAAREREAQLRGPLAEADRKAQRLETEIRTLQKLLAPAAGDRWPAILDSITVAKGFEIALGAALGDDLDAAVDASAPAHWRDTGQGGDDPALPGGAEALGRHVRGPAALARRLAQIGVVSRGDGPRLREAAEARAAAGLARGRHLALGRLHQRRRRALARRAPARREEPARRPRTRGAGRARGGRSRARRPRRRHSGCEDEGPGRGRRARSRATGPARARPGARAACGSRAQGRRDGGATLGPDRSDRPARPVRRRGFGAGGNAGGRRSPRSRPRPNSRAAC